MDLQQKQRCWKLEVEVLDSDSSWISGFDPSKKKKKKKKKKSKPLFQEGGHFLEDNAPHRQSCQNFDEPDYGYKELLRRAFDRLRDDDLEASTERPRTVMMPPHLLAQGTVTVCLNFADLCRTYDLFYFVIDLSFLTLLVESTGVSLFNIPTLFRMHRKPDHVMNFLLLQMETKGLLNKQQRLEMKGLVSHRDFQAVLRRYIDAFVICICCKSPDTALGEYNGLFTLRCEMCGLAALIDVPSPL
ncbi:PREDICTED: eukaryotic translation initiation factor 2 subunit beta isoform X1 [Camelina sativa]|uniref:Eukaryotic translation initiation factor 2 subunit beta isoform X1 n=1 Tax=Camelina sativa TaxID=90675 RepID=A0ABM0XSR1_CAMSA|nr:PREDICTED: eukaryotic translation initiation factor 2 subunit beta isoform X1 [Camelina sativa]